MNSVTNPNLTSLLSAMMAQGLPENSLTNLNSVPGTSVPQITGFALVPIYGNPVAQQQAFNNLLSSLFPKNQPQYASQDSSQQNTAINPNPEGSAVQSFERNVGPGSSEESTPPSDSNKQAGKKASNKRSKNHENHSENLTPNFNLEAKRKRQDKEGHHKRKQSTKQMGDDCPFSQQQSSDMTPTASIVPTKTESKKPSHIFQIRPTEYPEYVAVLNRIMDSSLKCRIKTCRIKPHLTYSGAEAHLQKHYPFPTVHCSLCRAHILPSIAEKHALEMEHESFMKDDRSSMLESLKKAAEACYPQLFQSERSDIADIADYRVLDEAFSLKELADPYRPAITIATDDGEVENVENGKSANQDREMTTLCALENSDDSPRTRKSGGRKSMSSNAIDSDELQYDDGTEKPVRYLEKIRQWMRAVLEGAQSCVLCPEFNARQDISKAESHLFSHVRKMPSVVENSDTKKIAYECDLCNNVVAKVGRHRKSHKDAEVHFKDLRPYIETELLQMIDQCCPTLANGSLPQKFESLD